MFTARKQVLKGQGTTATTRANDDTQHFQRHQQIMSVLRFLLFFLYINK